MASIGLLLALHQEQWVKNGSAGQRQSVVAKVVAAVDEQCLVRPALSAFSLRIANIGLMCVRVCLRVCLCLCLFLCLWLRVGGGLLLAD